MCYEVKKSEKVLEDELVDIIRKRVLDEFDWAQEAKEEEIWQRIGEEITESVEWANLSIKERTHLAQRVYNSLRRLDILQELIEDDTVTEIMVNGPQKIFYEKDGRVFLYPYHFSSEEKLQDVIQQIVGRHNRVVNLSSPIVDSRLENGARVNVVLSPISIDGSSLTIRKFPNMPLTIEQLIELESITQDAAVFLKYLVKAKYNLFISGGTGSGKTTFLNILSSFIPQNERIITIEDSAELQLQNKCNLVRLETRNENSEGVKEITIRELIRSALRMRPDRIVVGECRGPEALDMLQAMNTGHEGSLSTGHANSAKDMLSRLETMVLMGNDLPLYAVRQQIASAIDIIIHLGKTRAGKRKVLEITEILEYKEGEIITQPLYQYENALQKVNELKHKQKLERLEESECTHEL